MWGLVHPSLLNGEGGYYLTTLTSAVQVVKQLKFDNLALDEGKPENQVWLGTLGVGQSLTACMYPLYVRMYVCVGAVVCATELAWGH